MTGLMALLRSVAAHLCSATAWLCGRPSFQNVVDDLIGRPALLHQRCPAPLEASAEWSRRRRCDPGMESPKR